MSSSSRERHDHARRPSSNNKGQTAETLADHDAASIAAMHVFSDCLFRRVGGSTGTNFFGLCCIAATMKREGKTGSLATLICDGGERYAATYYNPDWLAEQKIDIQPWREKLQKLIG